MVLSRKLESTVNRKRVQRLMRELNIQSIIRKRKYPKPPAYKGIVYCPNILNRNFSVPGARQTFVSDVTYLFAGGQPVYLSAIMDLYNKEIVSYKIGKQNDLSLVLETLTEFLSIKQHKDNAIFHSDQGFQYTSRRFNQLLQCNRIIQSMSRKASPLDNAPIESFFGHLKTEAIYTNKIESYEKLQSIIHEYMYFYNNERLQEKLNKMAPTEYLNRCS